MTTFYFCVEDNEGITFIDEPIECTDTSGAIGEAKKVLAEMVLDGLPNTPSKTLAVQVLDVSRKPVADVCLKLDISVLP